jgi:hypothetical protein
LVWLLTPVLVFWVALLGSRLSIYATRIPFGTQQNEETVTAMRMH